MTKIESRHGKTWNIIPESYTLSAELSDLFYDMAIEDDLQSVSNQQKELDEYLDENLTEDDAHRMEPSSIGVAAEAVAMLREGWEFADSIARRSDKYTSPFVVVEYDFRLNDAFKALTHWSSYPPVIYFAYRGNAEDIHDAFMTAVYESDSEAWDVTVEEGLELADRDTDAAMSQGRQYIAARAYEFQKIALDSMTF